MNDSAQALGVALDAARAASKIHQTFLGTVGAQDWSQKGVADFVTHVDHAAETSIVAIIREHYPDHDIMAEEGLGPAQTGSEWLWVVDPLDGTTNFLHRYPMYCASIALLHRAEPVVGAVVCGPTAEEWVSVKGGGAFRNGARIHVSETDHMAHALIGTGFPFKIPTIIPHYLMQFENVLTRVSDIRRAGSAALDLCHLASGYLDGFWELDLRPWDYAAGVLMVREAGGVVTRLDGSEPDWVVGDGIVGGNAFVHNALSSIVQMSTERPRIPEPE